MLKNEVSEKMLTVQRYLRLGRTPCHAPVTHLLPTCYTSIRRLLRFYLCVMKIRKSKVPAILVASVLAVLGLVVFQWAWMRHSRALAEEIFNQRASMALCSSIEKYSESCAKSGGKTCCAINNAGTDSISLLTGLASDSNFQANLRKALDFYQINLNYQLSLTDQKQTCAGPFHCTIQLPTADGASTYVNLAFPEKEAFVLSKMNFMVAATVLILLFIAGVLLMANWSLMKQKRLLQTNTDFFNNMAHEFRTPLTNIGLAANLLSKKHEAMKDNSMLDVIRRENNKLLDQVERVLHLARLENGDYALQKERLPLRPLLQSVQEDMAIQIRESQAKVQLDAMPEHLEVLGDRLHLGNVFRNLLDNALKYSGDHPDIRISAQENPKGVVVSVQDNGMGIPACQSGLIFEKFQRVSHGNLHEQKGFGLGLAYVKSMVELHQGSVRVASELNQGSRFDVFLPKTA